MDRSTSAPSPSVTHSTCTYAPVGVPHHGEERGPPSQREPDLLTTNSTLGPGRTISVHAASPKARSDEDEGTSGR